MTIHTPGPWAATVGGMLIQADPNRDGRAIAKADHIDVGREQAEANARLIAAAPDLLKALQFLALTASYYRTKARLDRHCQEARDLDAAMVEMAAVVAKIRGEG